MVDGSKRLLNIGPGDVGTDGILKHPFERPALLLVRGDMISSKDIIPRTSL